MAVCLDMNRGHISDIECGKREAGLITLQIVARGLGTTISLLVDIATAWERADVSQKQRVQNVLFPSGLKYHPEKGILNSENDCLFNQLENFIGGKMFMVRPERFELPAY